MKIGLVCPYDMFKGGGVQECVRALQTELVNRGHEVLIITPRPRGFSKLNRSSEGMVLIGTSADIKSPFQATTAQVSASVDLKAIDEMLATHKFDVIHFHEPWVPMLSMQILAKSSCANVATFHAKLPETMLSKTVEKVITPYTKSILKSLDISTAVSSAAAEYYTAISKHNPVIIPNGVNINKYTRASDKSNEETKTILFVGRLEKRKGVKYLLMAFSQLIKNGDKVRLVIAGDGPERKKLETYVREKKISGVEFLGYVSDQQKIDLLRSCDIYCSPAIFGESFGIVLLEAMAAGAVVVAGNNPGYSAVMQGKGNLSIINPKDTESFTKKLELMLSDQELRKLWLNWAKDYIKQFDYKKITDQYEATYKEAIEIEKTRN
ncbi:MAG TPA: glycosyltransferase family 4 protein [Candidatus Saccharibacteria bacterium]|nr:glycosyltransferase family 4 protein [Candidatus Saccharibacteria bacterium]